MELKDLLKIERIPNYAFNENGLLRLNMSIKEIYDILQPERFEFFSELKKHGVIIDAPILASTADIIDYRNLDAKDNGPLLEYTDYEHGLVNVLCNLVYYEEEFVDESTGKHGLKDCLGNIIVPALFDSCKPHTGISFIDTLNVVELDGQKWLAARDGSGKLVTLEGFDDISCSYCYGWTRHGNKYGLLDSRTGATLVPCEMDWINDDHKVGMTSLICRDRKLGLVEYINPKDVTYYEPMYDAIDLATWKVLKGGKWGWVNRKGEFSTVPLESRFDIIMFEWDLEKYLGEKPLKHGEKDWFTDDELSDYLENCNREFDSKMKIKPSEACELPPLDMPDSFSDFLTLMEAIESNLNNGNNRLVVIPQIPIGLQAPILTIKRDNGYIVIEWCPISKDSAWKDAESPLIKSCNQIIRAGAQSYVLSFAKEFALDNISEAAKFIAYYYHSVWGLNQSQIDVQQYKYPQSVPTNQELS